MHPYSGKPARSVRAGHVVSNLGGHSATVPSRAVTDARATDAALTAAGRAALRRALPGHLALVRTRFFDGLDPRLPEPLRRALEQIHDQVIAHGSLPAPPSRQVDWTEP